MSNTDGDYGGGWSTAWSQYTVPQLAAILRYENDNLSWEQASTWQKTSELISYYQCELQKRRDELAAKWPPERSPAAQVFVTYIDDLLKSMQQTSSDAYSTSLGVSGITLALAEAKRKIGDLQQQWQANEEKEKHPRIVAAGKGGAIAAPQVPSNWRDQMQAEAAKVMQAAETAVFQHTRDLQVPVEYKIIGPTYDGEPWSPGGQTSTGGGASGGSSRVPVIPPPPSTPPGPVLTGGPSGGPPTATLPPPGGSPPVDPPVGRVLAPGSPPPVFPGVPGPVTWPSEPAAGRPSVPGKAFLGRGGVPGDSLPPRAGMPTSGEPMVHGAPVRPGGMPIASMGGVGGRPNSPTPGAGAAGGRRVNPVGGVLGGRGGESFTTPSGHMVSIGPKRSRNDRSDRRVGDQGFDPDDPWAVATGVPPVIEPSPEPRHHDPGPGVIGIDR
jgi:hypothetical protein